MLEVKNLKVALKTPGRRLNVVSDVGFVVRAGECFALVGESGCGKSMTALSLMRLLPEGMVIEAGSIRLKNEELLTLTEKEMLSVRGSRISMIFQEPATSLNPVVTVGDQIVEAVRLHEDVTYQQAKVRALEWLDRVGIDAPQKRFDAFAHELSGGQKQRVMIAMALACRPDVVVADEPTTALDVTLQAQILDLLKDLQQKEGIALVLITHDLAVVKRYADKIALMYAGQIVEEQSAAKFFAQPRHPYAKQLLKTLPTKEKTGEDLLSIKGNVPELAAMPEGCRYAPRCPIAKKECRQTCPPLIKVDDGTVRCGLSTETFQWGQAKKIGKLAEGETVFEVRDFSVAYVKPRGIFRPKETYDAVRDVSLAVREGGTLALVGESGSGKTTLVKAALGLLSEAKVSGSVKIVGRDAFTSHGRFVPDLRKYAQIVFQDPFASLDPRMTVGACIREGMRALMPKMDAAAQNARMLELLDQVGLSASAAEKLPHEFSGGQRQRIAIARALSVSPKVLVCDEPTSALDVSVQAQILNLLREIQRETSIALVCITHNFAVVEYMADWVAVMKDGSLVEAGSAEEVLTRPQEAYTKTLLSAVPRITLSD